MGFLDELTDALLGAPVEGIADGVADSLEAESEATQALAEAVAAEGFGGRQLRDLIVAKWGKEFDVEFSQTDYLGKSSIYLNVFPWSPDLEPYRHADQTAYLEHLEAVCERLVRWGRVAHVKRQIAETSKAPRRGTIPLKTVPIRLDLPNRTSWRGPFASNGGGVACACPCGTCLPTVLMPALSYFTASCAAAASRSTNFCTLPVAVFGSPSGTCTTCFGALKCASPARQWSMISSSVVAVQRWPSLSTTKAHGVSPHFSLGRATTLASSTAGWRKRTSSTSTVDTFSPPVITRSLARSRIST